MSRRIARQTAFQVLFEIDLSKTPINDALENRLLEVELPSDDAQYVTEIVTGTRDNIQVIDKLISRFSHDWKLERLAAVDRNILRLAIYEMAFRHDIPVKVTLNEAVEMAKVFGDNESPKFINGILGGIMDYIEEGIFNE